MRHAGSGAGEEHEESALPPLFSQAEFPFESNNLFLGYTDVVERDFIIRHESFYLLRALTWLDLIYGLVVGA
jgi:hypothetical protein